MIDANLSGWWEGKIHHFPMRVYYADTDAGGVVYHASYLDFAERARTEMIRSLNPATPPASYAVAFVVRACEIDYKRSVTLDALLVVRSKLVALGGASFRVQQDVCEGDNIMVRLGITLVAVREIGHATRVPDRLREKFAAFLNE